MRTIIIKRILIPAMLFQGCINVVQKDAIDATIVIDRTDTIAHIPTADDVIEGLGFRNEKVSSAKITITTISDKDLNERSTAKIALKSKWMTNIVERDNEIKGFKNRIQKSLDGNEKHTRLGHTIAYRTVAREANTLAKSNGNRKYLLVYSNLYENNGQINLYKADALKEPNMLAKQLNKSLPLERLNGVEVFLLYEPTSLADNNRFMPVAILYKELLESHGAVVHIDAQFSPQ